jgi:hypothetical protein
MRQGHFSAEFSLPEADGYSITVIGSERSVQVSVVEGQTSSRHLVSSDYTFAGSASEKGIHADFGSFGAVDLRFSPSGEIRTIQLPKVGEECDGPRKVERHLGTFVGSFRFEGEAGYTTAETAEVSGSVGDRAQIICWTSGRESKQGRHRNPPPSPYLGATTTHNSLGFAAARLGRHRKRTSFVASSIEKEAGVSIRRWASISASSSEFTFDRRLTTATVTPPAPFSGSATFERGPKGSQPSWSGSLTVSFPGRPEVPLTGPNFTSLLFSRF